MTDKEKLDKLVAEIERRYNEKDRCGDDIRANVYKSLLSFIDTTQKEAKNEAKIKVEQIMAEVDAKFPKFEKEYKDAQEPVSDDLEKEMQHYFCTEWAGDPIALAHHFAEWQKRRMIEKSCYYIRANMAILDVNNNDCMPEWLDEYKKAIEE